MISIKRLLEMRLPGNASEEDILAASLQLGRLLLEAIAAHTVRGREPDYRAFCETLAGLKEKIGESPSPLGLLEIGGEASEALEAYSRCTAAHFREQSEELHLMIAMLTDTVAEISGLADASVARLQAIELQIEQASAQTELRALRASMENCLSALREATAQQRADSAAAAERLKGRLNRATARLQERAAERSAARAEERGAGNQVERGAIAETPCSYVGVFKLQRADHIDARFGRGTQAQMLQLVAQNLKPILGPRDRLLRWRETAFVMFLTSTAPIQNIRLRLVETVAAINQQYIQVGSKAAMLSVGVDWIVFPQAQCGSLEAVFAEVDSFLRSAGPAGRPLEVGAGPPHAGGNSL